MGFGSRPATTAKAALSSNAPLLTLGAFVLGASR